MANIADIEYILKTLCWKRKNDPTAPSLTLSHLYFEKKFYGSLVRYDESFARGSKVITSIKADTLHDLINQLSTQVRLLPEPAAYKPTLEETNYDPEYTYVDDDIPF